MFISSPRPRRRLFLPRPPRETWERVKPRPRPPRALHTVRARPAFAGFTARPRYATCSMYRVTRRPCPALPRGVRRVRRPPSALPRWRLAFRSLSVRPWIMQTPPPPPAVPLSRPLRLPPVARAFPRLVASVCPLALLVIGNARNPWRLSFQAVPR